MRCLLLPFLLLVPSFGAYGQVSLEIAAASNMWIDGTSTVNRFTCHTKDIEGQGHVVEQASYADVATQGAISVPVRSFDCGNRRMNRDLHDALRAEAHPTITFNVNRIQAEQYAPSDDLPITVHGSLTIGGAVRDVSFSGVAIHLPDSLFRFQGSLPLRMTDFGVDPPRAMLGLVRAHDPIVVRFDLQAMQILSAD